ncbi:MAG: hypothetical protein FWF51_03635 [Chitinivibrionia bacterium]|nr:hypothetical protein [Chitinivibrionia bacterium]
MFCCFFVFETFCDKITEINYIEDENIVSENPNIEYSADYTNEKIRRKIKEFADSGYPFAQISPKITQENDSVKIDLYIKKGVLVKNIRPSFVITDGKIKEYLLQKPIENIMQKNSEIYNYNSLETAKNILQSKKYINSATFFSPEEKDGFYEIPITAKVNKSVLFNGGLGLATYPKTTIVGNADLDIINVLGFGETFNFLYVNEELFYKISADLQIPYFLKTPFDILFFSQIEIGDSLYGSVSLSAGTQYFFDGFRAVKMLAEYSELSVQDSVSRYGGIKIALENTKSRYNYSQKDAYFDFSLKSGAIYKQNDWTPKGEFTANSAFHIPVFAGKNFSRFAFLTKPNIGIIAFKTPQTLHETQLFRLGGANSVRGYQESVFSGLSFASLGNEFRYYIADFSCVYLLGDYAAILNEKYSLSQTEQIFGYGAGISLPVKNFFFSLEWARHIKDYSDFGRLHFRISTF